MDTEKPSLLPRPTGIPRLSKLPVPSSIPSSTLNQSKLRPAASNDSLRKRASQTALNSHSTPTLSRGGSVRNSLISNGTKKPSIPGAGRSPIPVPSAPKSSIQSSRRVSGIGLPRSTSGVKRDEAVFKKPFARPPSRQAQPIKSTRPENEKEDTLGSLDGFRASSRQGFRDDDLEQVPVAPQLNSLEDDTPAKVKKPRPSLSDRTVESLAQVPASPGPRRRRSSFFSPESPMRPPSRSSRPPSRSGSAMGSRPGTSDGPKVASTPLANKAPKLSVRNSLTAPQGRRSISAMTPKADPKPAPIRSLRPSSSVAAMRASGNSTLKPRASLGNLASSADPATPSKTRAGHSRSSITTGGVPDEPDSASRKASSSSAALRDQIAKAKAARKAAANKASSGLGSQSPEFDFDQQNDPFNQLPKGGDAVLRKRVDVARSSGRLNIAALGLSEIPDLVIKMFDFEANKDSNIAWSEAVDLERFNAADNDLEKISDDVFPDVDDDSSYIDQDRPGSQFGGVQVLDLHGNMLTEVPTGLRRLQQLTTLNLSRNRLTMASFAAIGQIASLRELRLAENALQGPLPSSIGQLVNLQTLELQGNQVSELPNEIIELASLHVLDVGNNKIRRLPMENLMRLPLTELLAPRNDLQGILFSTPSAPNPHLHTLNVSGNALTALTNGETPNIPNIKSLDVSINRITSLPDLASWTALLTILVAENKLTTLPDGFTKLENLRNADFASNDIAKIDDQIALMDSLENLSLAANPIRDRKFLTMNTADLKQNLRAKIAPLDGHVSDSAEAGHTDESFADALEEQTAESLWSFTPSGTLELASKGWSELPEAEFTAFASSHNVKQLYLNQNNFECIPSLLSLTQTITVLNLSANKIDIPLSSPLELPFLRDLKLSSNKLTNDSLESLCQYLTTPTLQTLDLTYNRLSGALPTLSTHFPTLLVLSAADNAIDTVDADALKGLKMVNLSNNNIEKLDPRIGLLAGQLTSLEVEGNRFRVPTYQVLKKGTEAVLGWLRDRLPESEVAGEGFD